MTKTIGKEKRCHRWTDDMYGGLVESYQIAAVGFDMASSHSCTCTLVSSPGYHNNLSVTVFDHHYYQANIDNPSAVLLEIAEIQP